MVNSQKVTQNSRASERAVVSSVTSVIPTDIPMSYICLSRKITGGVMISKGTINKNLVMSVYDNKMNLLTLLDQLPITLPVTLSNEAYIGVQGKIADLASIMGQCGKL